MLPWVRALLLATAVAALSGCASATRPADGADDVRGAATLVVLVHGWNGSNAGTWQSFPALLRQELGASTRVAGFEWPCVSGGQNVQLPQLAQRLDQFIAARESENGTPFTSFVVITHSTGGLIAKEWVAGAVESGQRSRLDRTRSVFLIGVPNFGSALSQTGSRIGRVLRGLAPAALTCVDLAGGSPYLDALDQRYRAAIASAPGLETISMVGVTKAEGERVISCVSGYGPTFPVIEFPGAEHTMLVKPEEATDRILRTVVDLIRGAAPAPSAPTTATRMAPGVFESDPTKRIVLVGDPASSAVWTRYEDAFNHGAFTDVPILERIDAGEATDAALDAAARRLRSRLTDRLAPSNTTLLCQGLGAAVCQRVAADFAIARRTLSGLRIYLLDPPSTWNRDRFRHDAVAAWAVDAHRDWLTAVRIATGVSVETIAVVAGAVRKVENRGYSCLADTLLEAPRVDLVATPALLASDQCDRLFHELVSAIVGNSRKGPMTCQ